MSARKKQSDDATVAVATRPSKPAGGRSWLPGIALLVALAGGVSYAAWQQVREHVLGANEYQLDPQKIVVSPPPPWIRSDVKAEVIRDAGFNGPLSLLDSELTLRIASAFAAHPWVAHVERVSKRYPAGLEVVLSYRKPVALVEVQANGALPVDANGIVLPTEDFQSSDAEHYPRIGEIHTTPTGPVGTSWGDPCVTGAAQIAAALAADWLELGLFRIVPAGHKTGGRDGAEYAFAILTRSGTKILWGRARQPSCPASHRRKTKSRN